MALAVAGQQGHLQVVDQRVEVLGPVFAVADRAGSIVEVLDRLARQRGAPSWVRFDMVPEFVAQAVNDWRWFNGIGSLLVDPGLSWQNAWIESFNVRLRDELLNSWHFDSLGEALERRYRNWITESESYLFGDCAP